MNTRCTRFEHFHCAKKKKKKKVARTYTDTYVFNSTQQKVQTLDLQLNAQVTDIADYFSFERFKFFRSHFPQASLKQFSGSIQAEYHWVQSGQTDTKIYYNVVQMELWQLYLAETNFYQPFLAAAEALNTEGTFNLNNRSYIQFLDT